MSVDLVVTQSCGDFPAALFDHAWLGRSNLSRCTTSTTGPIYSINRYYDPSTDQFLSVDPDVQTTDQPYAFVNDDPLNLGDPLGLDPALEGNPDQYPDQTVKPTIKVTIKIWATGNPTIQLASDSNEPFQVNVKVTATYTNYDGVKTETSEVFHYTSLQNAQAISNDGELIVAEESGQIYVSPTQYASAADAQDSLSLPNTPGGYFQIPLSRIPGLSDFTEVEPDFGFAGGGIEATTPGPINVEGIPFTPFE